MRGTVSGILPPRSSLDGARRQTGDDMLLREEENDDRGQDGERDEGEDQVPVGRVLSLIGHDAERPWIKVIAVEEDQRQQVGVPALDEGDGPDRCDDGRDSGRVMWRKKPI